MTCGLVHASYSLPEWQAVKLTFFAPWLYYFLFVLGKGVVFPANIHTPPWLFSGDLYLPPPPPLPLPPHYPRIWKVQFCFTLFKNFGLKSPSLSEFPTTLHGVDMNIFTFNTKRQWHQFRAFSSSLDSFLSHGLKYSSHVLAGFIVECIRRKSPTSVTWRAVTKPSRHQLNYHAMHSGTLEKNPINVISVIKLSLDMMTSSDITAFILVGTPCIITVQSVRFDT